MRKGFHTNAFVWSGLNDIVEIAKFAHEAGFDFLEVGPGIELDCNKFEEASKYVDFDAFIYCRNFIDDDEQVAVRERKELYRRMEFAASVGAKRIVCSTGISKALSIPAAGGCNPLLSIDKVSEFLNELLEKAESLSLEVCLENCPMFRNIGTSPLMWREIFKRIPSERLGLCYDPAHFVWQMIDVYKPFTDFPSRIRHIHMKDTALDRAKLDDVGILHNTGTEKGFEENQWWRHTIIGDGEIDWQKFMKLASTLPVENLDLSFEMEDYKFEGNPQSIKEGLKIQLERLKKY